MKNIPSFKQFKENYSLLESAGDELELEFAELMESLDPRESIMVNEGIFGDMAKNWASKTFLGVLGLSKVKYIDKARNVLLSLEMELLEREHEHEKNLHSFKDEINSLSPDVPADKPRIEALNKKIEEENRVYDAYVKAQKLKVEKAKEIINTAIDGNARRRAYAEAGLAEDKITLADKEYEMAKKRSESSETLDELTEKIKRLRGDLDEKVKKFKEAEEEKEEKEQKITKMEKETVSDPIAKRIIENIKKVNPKGIIDIKEEIKKDIATLEADRDRLGEEMKKKMKSPNITTRKKKEYKDRLSMIKAQIEGRKTQLDALEGLGKSSVSLRKNMKDSKKSNDILETIAKTDIEIESEKSKS